MRTDGFGVIEDIVFLFACDFLGAFLRELNSEGFVTESRAMTCILIEREQSAEEEGPIF